MKKTDLQPPTSAQAKAEKAQQIGLFSQMAKALQAAFYKVFHPLYYISLDMSLPLTDLQSELYTIMQLKRKGYQVQVLHWKHDTTLCQPFLCNGCPKRPLYPTEHSRRQEVVLKILDELFGAAPEASPNS